MSGPWRSDGAVVDHLTHDGPHPVQLAPVRGTRPENESTRCGMRAWRSWSEKTLASHVRPPGVPLLREVLHPRGYLLHQEAEGALHQRMVVRVLGDGEQMPKAPDLRVELANFVGTLL